MEQVCSPENLRRAYRTGKTEQMIDGLISQRTEGTPQGSPLFSPLSNIVLDGLDKELEGRGHRTSDFFLHVIYLVSLDHSLPMEQILAISREMQADTGLLISF
ncbi:MAG: hypothetical protein LBG45_00435 [Dysgonamonadaceae bacterium]|nr:hypothetical protein [Dysgonamonadaceae bacterium]